MYFRGCSRKDRLIYAIIPAFTLIIKNYSQIRLQRDRIKETLNLPFGYFYSLRKTTLFLYRIALNDIGFFLSVSF